MLNSYVNDIDNQIIKLLIVFCHQKKGFSCFFKLTFLLILEGIC